MFSSRIGSWPTLAALAGALLAGACRDAAPPQPAGVAWRQLGSWSGRGSIQTDPFISDTGSLRLRWETKNESPSGAGFFRVTVHSDVSGRPLVLAVDVRGNAGATTYVTEDPRPFFLAVESGNLDWWLAADEAVATSAAPGARGR
jgi:hypothetical protein